MWELWKWFSLVDFTIAIKNNGEIVQQIHVNSDTFKTLLFMSLQCGAVLFMKKETKFCHFLHGWFNQCINLFVISQPSLCDRATTPSTPPSTPTSSEATTGAPFPSAMLLCRTKTIHQLQTLRTDYQRLTPTWTARQNPSTCRMMTRKTATIRTCK